MKKVIPLLILVFLAGCAAEQSILKEYRGKYRIALLFAKHEGRTQALRQELRKFKKEMHDSNVLFMYLYLNGQSWFGNRPLPNHVAQSLRANYQAKDEVTSLVILGKDGQIELRQNDGVDLRQAFKELSDKSK